MFERLQASLLKVRKKLKTYFLIVCYLYLQNDPATTAFYKAQLWTERRVSAACHP